MNKKNIGLLIAFLVLAILTFTINWDEIKQLFKMKKVEEKAEDNK